MHKDLYLVIGPCRSFVEPGFERNSYQMKLGGGRKSNTECCYLPMAERWWLGRQQLDVDGKTGRVQPQQQWWSDKGQCGNTQMVQKIKL